MGLLNRIWFRSRKVRNRTADSARPRRRRFPLTVELLEDRAVPTAGLFLQGTAFIDANHDHTLDAGDPRLPGALIALYQGTGPSKVFLSSTTTDATGAYLFQDNNPNDTPVITNLTPGTYTLVETPPSGLAADGTQVLSQINPATPAGPGTIEVKLVDPTSLYVVTNQINFFNRNAWDYLQQTFHFTGAGVTSGSPTVTMSNTNPLAVGEPVTVLDGVTTLSSTIASIAPNTSVTLNAPWPGSPGNSATVDSTTSETAGQLPFTAGTIQTTGATVTSGTNVVGNIANTSSFFIGEKVNVSDTTAALDSTITGIIPNTSISLADTWTDASSNSATVLSDVNQPFLSLCWDLQNFLTNRFDNPPEPDTNTFQVIPTSGQGSPLNAGRIAYLFNHYGTVDIANSPSGSPAQAVGLQVAIWELEYDGTFTDLQVLQEAPLNSNSLGMELGQIISWANFYLNDSAGQSETATFLEANGSIQGGEQGLIVTGSLNFGNLGSPGITTTPSATTTTDGGQFATIGFWHNKNGQAAIKNFDTGPSSTQLGNALASTYPHLFGSASPYLSASLSGQTNAQVAADYLNVWPPSGLTRNTYVQAFAVAFGLYDGGNAGTFNVGSNGAAFGVANGTTLPVTQILQIADSNFNPGTGTFYGGDSASTSALNNVLDGINSTDTFGGTGLSSGTKLQDSATLSGGINPGGTITFYLFAPGVTPNSNDSNNVYSNVVTVNGDGTYTTAMGTNPGGYAPTVPGTYQWVAVYSGDSSNSGVTSPFGSEPFTVGMQTPTFFTTPGPSVVIGSGAKLNDSATLADAVNPTGTITFYLFAPGVMPNSNNSNNVYSNVVTINANGTYTTMAGTNPGGYLPTVTGTYQWVAVFSGDADNAPDTQGSPFGSEPETVTPASPTINTTQQPASATVGASVADKATVSGGFNPTGTVTFNLYNNLNGTGTPLFTDTETLVGGMAASKGYTTTATGTDYWVATYNGDSNNNPVTSNPASEPVLITPATPSINTWQQPPTATVGNVVADKAAVTGGFNPTGTVTFNLYNNPNGTGTPLFTDTESLVNGMATSKGYATTATGTDYWVATYNGDSNNNSVTSGTALEPVVITPATPSINTWQQPATAVVGSVVADKAKVSGGFNPTGSVTFNLYNNPNGTGTPLFTDTENLVNGFATSAGYTTTATGTDYWVATYNGDSNNNPVTSSPTAEPVVITPATPSINTWQQPPSATVGTPVADKAKVSGGFNPTGTVTFNLYNNPNGLGTPLFTDTESLSGGTAVSKSYTPTATGTDYWVATYNGDSNNNAVTSGTASEPVIITPATPSINTWQQPPTATVGDVVADKAAVTGGFNPTGTVTFNLYNNPNGTGTPLFTDTESLLNGMATSRGYATTATGTDYWVATYNGDSNNNSVTSGTALEPVVITPATPSINTSQQPATAMAGTSIADKATVSGGFYPTGTVTFNLYNNPNGSGTPLFTDTENLASGMATSKGYTAITAGTDYWVATYNGDSNNSSVTSGTALEPVTITPVVDVSVTKVASAQQVVFGTNVTYTFVIHNSGPSTATNVIMSDTLPNPGLSFVSAIMPSQGTYSYDSSTHQLTWNVGTLAVNGSAAWQITAQVTSTGPIVNTATVQSAEFDTNLANNVSSVTITGLQGPGQISKTSFLSSSAPSPALGLVSDHAPAPVNGVFDPSFELPGQGSEPAAYTYDPLGSLWTFSGWAGLTGNGSAFTGSNPTAPDGSQVAFLQGNGTISQSVNLAAGSYIITFDAAQRANWQSSSQTIGVYVDTNLVGTIRPGSTSYAAYSTSPIRLIAGNHVIRFTGLNPNGGDNTAFIDQVSLQSTPLNQPFDPGFETPGQGSGPGAFRYNPTGSQWTFTGAAGLTGNGSAFTGSNPSAPQGNQVAFLQGYGSLSQNVSLAAGTYVIIFDAAQRANWQASFQTIGVYVDNSLVGTVRPGGTSYGAYGTSTFSATAGNHAIRFTALDPNGGDNTAFIDQVSLQNIGVNQPLDPGFEMPGQGSGAGAYSYAPGGSPWTFSNSAGLAGNGSAFTAGNPNAPEGNQVAFLQGNGSVSQNVNFTAGSYIITFDAAQRANWQASAQTISILVDGAVVGTVTPSGTTYGSYGSNRFTVTTGKHTISFVGLNLLGHDNTAFIDQVTISAF